jgi:hypothetical protein
MSICPCDQIVTPELVIPAGLNALPRQIRAFPEIRRALLAAIPQQPALRDWRARNSQDLGLMLIDMWAYVSDVLAFYDERIANEEYIRTAVRRPSLRRLVDLLGFVPSPGQAAKVTLAALAEGRTGLTLPAGTGFRSDAFGTEPPQVFELSQDTPIHPLKNEWTLGAQPTVNVSQATPSEAASGAADADGNAADPRSFLVFDTHQLGVARDRFALISIGTGAPTATQVTGVTPFGGKDGNTYAEVAVNPAVSLGNGDPSQITVQVPTVTAVVTQNAILTGDKLPIEIVDGVLNVFFDSIYRQLHTGDPIIILSGSDPPLASKVMAVNEELTQIPSTDPAVKVPVTKVTLSPAPKSLPTLPNSAFVDTRAISFRFVFVRGGTVTTVAKTDVGQANFSSPGASVNGIVQVPPGTTPSGGASLLEQEFLLTDLDKNGVDFNGTLRIDAAGRATITAEDPTEFPATLKTPITVFGNVLVATRGETVNGEVLGNGDPTQAGQKFKLKKKPLTYVPAANDLGRTSTLQIFVDKIQWREVQSFFGCGPQSQVFTVRFDDDLNTIVIFGDGVSGARLTAGVGNVVATYRFGSGAAAPPAGAIQQIARSVIGLRAVRSPVQAFPGKDPDSADDIRKNAPRTALLFNRLVSTDDFQGYASFYAGVIKAAAEFSWDADKQAPVVSVTVIGNVDVDALQTAMIGLAEQSLIVKVKQAIAIPMTLGLNLEIDTRFHPDDVFAAVVKALTDKDTGPLAQQQASIGGQFLASPVFATVQGVAGVVSLASATIFLSNFPNGVDLSQLNGFFDLGEAHILCVPAGGFLDFTGPSAKINTFKADSQGTASASPDKGC